MEIKFCDTCGKKTEKTFSIPVPVGAEQLKNAGMSSYCQWIDGKMESMMGRSEYTEVCVTCRDKIIINSLSFLDSLKEENKDRLEKVKTIISSEM